MLLAEDSTRVFLLAGPPELLSILALTIKTFITSSQKVKSFAKYLLYSTYSRNLMGRIVSNYIFFTLSRDAEKMAQN